MIKAVLLAVYLYGLLPLLIGTAVTLLTKHRIGLPKIYLSGYIFYLTLFELLVVWVSHRRASYTRLFEYWKLTVIIMTIVVLVCIGLCVPIIRTRHENKFKDIFLFSSGRDAVFLGLSRESLIIICLILILTVLAVFFLIPHAFDYTPELARISLASDTFFSLDPATGAPYTDSSAIPGALHLFYAFGSTMTGIDVTTLIHLIIPIFLIPFFMCVHITIAHCLFPEKEQSCNRFRFVWLIALFYLLMLPLEAHIALAPYRNIWNGITLAASCFIPLFIAVCLNLSRGFASEYTISTFSAITNIFGLLCLILTLRLCIPFGYIVCSLYILAAVLIILVSLIWRKRVASIVGNGPKGGESL